MKHEWTAELLTYWDRLRGNRAAPTRQDIQPRDLGAKLPHIFVLHPLCTATNSTSSVGQLHDSAVNAPLTQPAILLEWQFRLAGTRICSFYNRELRETRFLSLWHEATRPWLIEHMTQSAFDCRPLRLEHVGRTLGERQCRFETILLPLKESDGSFGWLGSTLALEAPLWLGSEPLINNDLGWASYKASGEHSNAHKPASLKSILEALLERYKTSTPLTDARAEALPLPLTTNATGENALAELEQPYAQTIPATPKPPLSPIPQAPAATPSRPMVARPLTPRAESLLAQLNRTISSVPPSQPSKKTHPVTPENSRRLGHLTLIPGGKKQ